VVKININISKNSIIKLKKYFPIKNIINNNAKYNQPPHQLGKYYMANYYEDINNNLLLRWQNFIFEISSVLLLILICILSFVGLYIDGPKHYFYWYILSVTYFYLYVLISLIMTIIAKMYQIISLKILDRFLVINLILYVIIIAPFMPIIMILASASGSTALRDVDDLGHYGIIFVALNMPLSAISLCLIAFSILAAIFFSLSYLILKIDTRLNMISNNTYDNV
jgi:hypothetical protein